MEISETIKTQFKRLEACLGVEATKEMRKEIYERFHTVLLECDWFNVVSWLLDSHDGYKYPRPSQWAAAVHYVIEVRKTEERNQKYLAIKDEHHNISEQDEKKLAETLKELGIQVDFNRTEKPPVRGMCPSPYDGLSPEQWDRKYKEYHLGVERGCELLSHFEAMKKSEKKDKATAHLLVSTSVSTK